MRPETGPMRFGDDWTGLFIRGDNALGYAVYLRVLLDTNPEYGLLLQSLLSDLESVRHGDVENLQQLPEFETLVPQTRGSDE